MMPVVRSPKTPLSGYILCNGARPNREDPHCRSMMHTNLAKRLPDLIAPDDNFLGDVGDTDRQDETVHHEEIPQKKSH